MNKNTKHKINNHYKLNKLYKKYKKILPAVFFVVFVATLSFTKNSVIFKSSILEIYHPFDGAETPIKKSANYLTWKGDIYTDNYNSISDKINIAKYKQALSDQESDEIKNAKITYPVVYMGTYNYDHKENLGSHLAVDIKAAIGTPVYNIANGVVTKKSMKSSGFGHHICIMHKNVPNIDNVNKIDITSCYANMDTITVNEGVIVARGSQIGITGNKDNTTA